LGIEWFRDLSVIILCFITSIMLIFSAVITYRLYRTLNSTLLLIKATSKIAYDVVSLVQECIKPLIPILALIKGVGGGFRGVLSLFKQKEGGKS
jgi:hypothetical protein